MVAIHRIIIITIVILWSLFIINSFIFGILFLTCSCTPHEYGHYVSDAFMMFYYITLTLLLVVSALTFPACRLILSLKQQAVVDVTMYYVGVSTAYMFISTTLALSNDIYMNATALMAFLVACIGTLIEIAFIWHCVAAFCC